MRKALCAQNGGWAAAHQTEAEIPLSSEYGAYTTVKAIFQAWLPGGSPPNVLSCSLFARQPGVEFRENVESMSQRYYLFEVAFVWELTKETTHLPLGYLQDGGGGDLAAMQLQQHRLQGLLRGADDGEALIEWGSTRPKAPFCPAQRVALSQFVWQIWPRNTQISKATKPSNPSARTQVWCMGKDLPDHLVASSGY